MKTRREEEYIKKVISLFLILLLFTVSSFEVVFAADKASANKSQISSETYIIEGNKYTVKIVEDNNSIRKVFVEEEDKLTVVTYNNKDTTVGIGTIIGLLAGAGGVVSSAIYFYNAKQDANHCDYYFNRVQF
ncbi:hypothetical protein SAMN02745195_02436 [Thermoanaerobacter uzonensis DSM 18761]|uniref:Uncharacterized protein n=1 Tax=Thermoanaerobacter uzonensis DSM 18761 TaxID=1123369 RepID=A0A1M5AYT9_9THEO|nr:hypothetical protein [Thermoanaerobacter uzonensis]SHF35316.1 hypothetical protein SAMN02745195_02436 [Thermoanaerobacter uzonensis DSM 18761]